MKILISHSAVDKLNSCIMSVFSIFDTKSGICGRIPKLSTLFGEPIRYSGMAIVNNCIFSILNSVELAESRVLRAYLIKFDLFGNMLDFNSLSGGFYSGNMVGLYGMIYTINSDLNSIVSLDCNTGKEHIVFSVPKSKGRLHSICRGHNKWFVGNSVGNIVDLSTERIIHSGLSCPQSLFFDSKNNFCFCDFSLGDFYFGENRVYIDPRCSCALEDVESGGYWVMASNGGMQLHFVDYEGEKGVVFDFRLQGICANFMVDVTEIWRKQ